MNTNLCGDFWRISSGLKSQIMKWRVGAHSQGQDLKQLHGQNSTNKTTVEKHDLFSHSSGMNVNHCHIQLLNIPGLFGHVIYGSNEKSPGVERTASMSTSWSAAKWLLPFNTAAVAMPAFSGTHTLFPESHNELNHKSNDRTRTANPCNKTQREREVL